MIGLSVQFWKTEDPTLSSGFMKMLRDYYYDSDYGHTALKLTLPANKVTQKWVETYCFDEQDQLILPVRKLKDLSDPTQKLYEIYFSWYPDGFFNHEVSSIRERSSFSYLLRDHGGEMFAGANPDHEIQLPLNMSSRIGICPEKLLFKMREFVDKYDFDFRWLNCSHAVRYILLEGLVEPVTESMSTWQSMPALWDNPTRVLTFACYLEKIILQLNLEKASKPLLSQFKNHASSYYEVLCDTDLLPLLKKGM